MQVRTIYENVLTELNKVQAPSLLLSDFVYMLNKAIQSYFNKRYTNFEINQQLTDDLRVLTKTKKIIPQKTQGNNRDIFGISYKCELPLDYVHILNCICEFNNSKAKCEEEKTFQVGANKLDTDKWSSVITNYYMQPSIRRPYYYIVNIDEPEKINLPSDSDKYDKNFSDMSENRYGNTTIPTMEIKCGKINPNQYSLKAIYIDYLRSPQYIDLTEEDLDSIDDTTQQLEFPDYVVYEIIKEIVTMCLENAKDQRLQTYNAVNNSTK